MSESFAAREAALAREILDRTQLRLSSLPEGANVDKIALRLHAAQRALALVRERHADPYAHLVHLEGAEREMTRLVAALRRPACGDLGLALAKKLEPLVADLAGSRAPTIDQLASLPHRAGEVADDAPYRCSRGVPETWHVDDVPAPIVEQEPPQESFEPPTVDVDQLFEEVRRGNEVDLDAFIPEIPEPITEPEDIVELRIPRPTLDIDVRGLNGELAQLRRIVRDCAESIGVLGNLRRLHPEDPWSDGVVSFETRLLQKLDALFALGVKVPGADRVLSPLDDVVRWAADGATSDVFRAFARALILSCCNSEAAARAAVVELRRSNPMTLEHQSEGFALASGAAIDEGLRSALRDEKSPEHLVAILDALCRREGRRSPGHVVAEAVPLLQHPDDVVRAAAVRCVAAAGDEGVAALIAPRVDDAADEVMMAALEVMLRFDMRQAQKRLRAELEADVASPGTLSRSARVQVMQLLAIGGAGDEAELLRAAITAEPATIEALGWHGHVGHVPTLMELVESDDEEPAAAAERALQRITGAEVERDGYKAWWAENTSGWGDARRRLGEPYRLGLVVDELRERDVRTADRDLLARELRIAGASRIVDVRGWAAAQEADLGALATETLSRGERSRPLLESVPEGRWLSAARSG